MNHEKRTRLSSQKLHWTVENHWSSIIFSDDSKIELGHNNNINVWRKSDERLHPECLGTLSDRETQCRASVMFWG